MFYLLFVLYFILSPSFSSGEAAKFSVRDLTKLNKYAKSFVNAKDGIETLVLGNNVANILVGQLLAQHVAKTLPTWVQGAPWAIFMLIATVIFGESIPKKLGESHPELVLNVLARPLLGVKYVLAPFTGVLTWFNELIPCKKENEQEKTTVQLVMELDTTSVGELQLDPIGNPETYDHHWIFSGDVIPADTMIDTVIGKLLDGKELLVMGKKGPVGILTKQIFDDHVWKSYKE